MEFESDTPPKKRRGRNLGIEDGPLWGAREHLVWLLGTTWDGVECALSSMKTAAEVLVALQIWKGRSSEYVTVALLRPSSSPATSKQLNEWRRGRRVLNKKAQTAYEFVEKCVESFERAMRIPIAQLSQGEQIVVDDEIRKRGAVLAHAGKEYLAIHDQQETLESLLKDGEAYFARAEFVRFCRSKRYRLTPLNTANALAGLPFIGWRQSAKRCKKWESAGAKGISFQIFEVIRRIVASNTRRSELVRDAELWLRSRRSTKSTGVSDLQQHWYYLRRSIQTELDKGISRRHLPSAISKEYWRRKSNPSPVDLAFAEEEIIVN